MKKNMSYGVLAAALLVLAGCGKGEGSGQQAAGAPVAQASAPAAAPAGKPADGQAIAVIETDTYVMKVHRAIPFMPRNEPAGMLKVKEGHRYVVFDISVRNKSSQPLEMGSIMLVTKIADETGKSYGGHLGALTSYLVDNPDPNHDAEYEGVWSMELPPGAFHRALSLGVEAPVNVNAFVISAPPKPNDVANMRSAKFSLPM